MKIGILGLGYVGLPLAISLSKHHDVVGFDISMHKVALVEAKLSSLRATNNVVATQNEEALKGCDIYIVTVPTPVDSNKEADLSPLIAASKTVGGVMAHGCIVVYESTVFPGATEEHCVPVLEEQSGMALNKEFSVGYSPERISPSDSDHSLHNTNKLVAASSEDALITLSKLYQEVLTSADVITCSSIKIAEAAKLVENIQRDVNIALMNELSSVFAHIGINTLEVIEAASSKWNFHPYRPGLVGGHCIGVDPYYMVTLARKKQVSVPLIEKAREVNEDVVHRIWEGVKNDLLSIEKPSVGLKVLLLGVSFKEDCEDTRNSQALRLWQIIRDEDNTVDFIDPIADIDSYYIHSRQILESTVLEDYDVIINCVRHASLVAVCSQAARLDRDQTLYIDLFDRRKSKGFSL